MEEDCKLHPPTVGAHSQRFACGRCGVVYVMCVCFRGVYNSGRARPGFKKYSKSKPIILVRVFHKNKFFGPGSDF